MCKERCVRSLLAVPRGGWPQPPKRLLVKIMKQSINALVTLLGTDKSQKRHAESERTRRACRVPPRKGARARHGDRPPSGGAAPWGRLAGGGLQRAFVWPPWHTPSVPRSAAPRPEPSRDSPPRPARRAVPLPRRAPSGAPLRGCSSVLVAAAVLVHGPPASGFRAVVLGVQGDGVRRGRHHARVLRRVL